MPYLWDDISTCLKDHTEFLTALPLIAASAFLLTPAEGETVHLSVNSVTACPYCTGLHGNLGRMAGCDSKGIEGAKTDEECASKAGSTSSNEHEIALYARTFAKSGYSADAQKTLSAKVGQTKAKCVNAMCLFLKWGSYGGNTINDTVSNPSIFKIGFSLYYGPLYVIVKVVSALLTVMPTNGPKALNQVMSFALPIIAGAWIVPVGMLGFFWPFAGKKRD
ncbi:hypothetical protein TrST_g5529 [Triparma strigata]|uniref:Uncharacterized protein n=1 Tax=Triparma strigata TaxID=1606541 RepID=A0A9W7BHA1_9STRA|nr:hypothetical protein TrST_g5529 [Triparma strigata]